MNAAGDRAVPVFTEGLPARHGGLRCSRGCTRTRRPPRVSSLPTKSASARRRSPRGSSRDAVDLLRSHDPNRRVDVIYICSNANIARQNINRLNVTGQPSHDLPDRITMLPKDISRLSKNSGQFHCLHPWNVAQHAVERRTSGGTGAAVLAAAGGLAGEHEGGRVPPHRRHASRTLQGARRGTDAESRSTTGLKNAFRAKLAEEVDAIRQSPAARSASASWRSRISLAAGRKLSDEEGRTRTEIVGGVAEHPGRRLHRVARARPGDSGRVPALQRPASRERRGQPAGAAAVPLSDKGVHGDVRVLLLSATPYRMFTTADDARRGWPLCGSHPDHRLSPERS